MNQSTKRRTRAIALIVAVASFAALAGQASLAASGHANPRLSLSSGQESPGSQSSLLADRGIGELQRSLKRLTGTLDLENEKSRVAASERLHSALTGLSAQAPVQAKPSTAEPRLIGRVDRQLTHADAAAFMASIGANLMTASQIMAPQRKRQDVMDVPALRQAMQRFDLVTDAVASDAFSRVFLGLSEMVPTLSGEPVSHPRVSKADLRAEVVSLRTAAAATSFTPPLAYEAPTMPGQRLANVKPEIDTVVDIESAQIAGLSVPLGPAELGGMSAASDSEWTDSLPVEEQYAMAEELDMDQLDMDQLGGGTLASLESPVDTGQLQETRAGFVLNNGVHIDFAVTRLTSVDGIDQIHTITNMPQGLDSTALSQISSGQSGSARVLSPSDGAGFSIIQNGLDNQRILDVTTIDVGIRNFGIRSMNYIRPSMQRDAIPAELR